MHLDWAAIGLDNERDPPKPLVNASDAGPTQRVVETLQIPNLRVARQHRIYTRDDGKGEVESIE